MCFLNEFFRVRRVVVVASCCLCRELWLYARGWRVLLAERTLFLEGNQTNTHTQTHTKTRARALKSDDGSDAYVLFFFVVCWVRVILMCTRVSGGRGHVWWLWCVLWWMWFDVQACKHTRWVCCCRCTKRVQSGVNRSDNEMSSTRAHGS